MDVALTICAVPGGNDGAIHTQAESVAGARRNRGDVTPVPDVALPVLIVTEGENPAVLLECHRMVAACSHRHHISPPFDVAFA
jgi:hypothetical protein